jgi:hypothetical protein
MKGLWHRHPWLPLALLTACFMLAWLAWLLTALRNAPESILTSTPSTEIHAPAR